MHLKLALSQLTCLAYPDFSQAFEIHTDASDKQLGAVISQNERPKAFYTRKLNNAQQKYTTTERELLSIVETLKEFRNILLGQKLIVHTDHKNLTYKSFNSDRVIRWRLILEEYGPELRYIKGSKNIVADSLSRLDILEDSNQKTGSELATHYQELMAAATEELDDELMMPVAYSNIKSHQEKDKNLHSKLQSHDAYHIKKFHGGGRTIRLICHTGKIVIPDSLKLRVLTWYHTMLIHPGAKRTVETIRQHFYWKGMQKDVEKFVRQCPTCQKTKVKTKNYGHLPEKNAEYIPWEKLCVDLIGPYKIPNKKTPKKPRKLWCVTMIDPATGWVEIKDIDNKCAATVANIVEQTWLARYPRPQEMTYDQGTEFMAEFAEMIDNDYGIIKRPITVRNPQANSVIEQVHQTIGNMLRTFKLYDKEDWDEKDPWSGILSAIMFAMRATYHTTTQASSMQLIFSRDAVMNLKFNADWNFIKERKQQLIKQNNHRENSKRIPHVYQVGDKVLLEQVRKTKHGEHHYDGPYRVIEHNQENGTVTIQKRRYTDIVNIRQVKPYTGQD